MYYVFLIPWQAASELRALLFRALFALAPLRAQWLVLPHACAVPPPPSTLVPNWPYDGSC